jgi:hypothetical protein
MLQRELYMQLLLLLHVLNSFIILQTEYLKPFFHSHGGLEKLIQEVKLPEPIARQARELRDEPAKLLISQMPMNAAFGLGGSSDDDAMPAFKPEFERNLSNPRDFLVVPVTIKHFYIVRRRCQRAAGLFAGHVRAEWGDG